MTYKTILVHLDEGKRCPARVEIAIRLARHNDAHLIGLNALTHVELPGYVLADAGGAAVADIQKRHSLEQAASAKSAFSAAVAATGLSKAEWRTSALDAVEAVTRQGRYADLIVLGQPWDEDDSGVERGFAQRVALEAGRPLLMIPYAGEFRTIGKRVFIAWKTTREATRAVSDAVPFLQKAEAVQVVAINAKPDAEGSTPGSEIALYLARHGVRVEVKVDRADEGDAGQEILSRAADFSADLIVMGAYGHSRVRELVLGGASRTIFESMTVPVLLSH